MKQAFVNTLPLWQFDIFSREQNIRHFVSQRNIQDDSREFTLSFSSSPDRTVVQSNRDMVASALGIPSSRLIFPSQVHKTRIVNVTRFTPKEALQETDALITAESSLCIAVMSADCVPILLYDKRNHAIAAIHSGWRGTVARILEKTLNEMSTAFGTQGHDLIAGIGPSVCQESYEVGEEVISEVMKAFGGDSGLMVTKKTGKAHLDLWKANQLQLLDFGVSPENIEVSNLCTVKHNHHFFSARKGDGGRFAAGIMLL